MVPFLFIGGFIAFAVGMILLNLHWERQRAEALQAVAQELGLSYSPKDAGLVAELKGFHIGGKGSSHAATHVMRGQTAATDVVLFEFTYTVTSGGENSSSTTHCQTIIRFRSHELALPSFALRPKHFMHRIATLFGFQAITLEDQPGFTERWLLRGKDEAAIRGLFRDDVVQFFEQEKGIAVEGRDQVLLVYREDERVKPDMMRAFLDEAYQIFALWRTDGGAA